jgi:hypothetical protein
MGLQSWIQETFTPIAEAAARAAVDEAKKDIIAEIGALKTQVLMEIRALPVTILGAADKTVDSLLDEYVPNADLLASEVRTTLGPMFSNVALNPEQLEQLVTRIIGSFNPFREPGR